MVSFFFHGVGGWMTKITMKRAKTVMYYQEGGFGFELEITKESRW